MSVIQDFSVSGLFPSKAGGTGLAIKYFPRLLGSSIGVSPATPSATNATGMLAVYPASVLNGQQFNVKATGSFGPDTGGPSGTVQIKLQVVTPNAATGSYSVSPVYTTISQTTAFAPVLTGAGSWAIQTHLYGDTLSGFLGGSFNAYVNGALSGAAQQNTLAVISGISFAGGTVPASLASATGGPGTVGAQAPFGLVVGVTFGTSDAANTASMYEFSLSTD